MGEAYDIQPEQYALQYTMSGGGLINYPLYTVGNNTFVNYGEESMEELATAIAMNRNSSIDSNLHGVSHLLLLPSVTSSHRICERWRPALHGFHTRWP